MKEIINSQNSENSDALRRQIYIFEETARLSVLVERKAENLEEDSRIKMDDFDDCYEREIIEADRKKVDEIKNKIKEHDKRENQNETTKIRKIAKCFELIINNLIEMDEWFGMARTTKTCEYDDFVNGIDSVIEIESEDGNLHLPIAIDMTIGKNTEIEKKIRRIKTEIDEGTLASVRYYVNESGTYKGGLEKIPRIILGADLMTASRLFELWTRKGERKELRSDPIQIDMQEAIIMQLEKYKKYAEEEGKEDLIPIFEKYLRFFKSVKETEEKRLAREKREEFGINKFMITLRDQLSHFRANLPYIRHK